MTTSGQEAEMNLFENSLYNTTNDSKVNQEINVELTGFISASNFGTARINSLISNDFQFPYVTAGDFGRNDPDNKFSGNFPAEKDHFVQILATLKYSSFQAVLAVLNHFNWTLVGNLYEPNTYGYIQQQYVLDYSSKYTSPIFTCNSVFSVTFDFVADPVEKNTISDYCYCVTSKSTINVVVLWMSTSTAYGAIRSLQKRCSASKKWTFLITDDFQTPTNFFPDSNVFQYSLLIRNNGPWDYKTFIKSCKDNANPTAKETLTSLLKNYYKLEYLCEFEPNPEENLKTCPVNLLERRQRNETCVCTLDEFITDPYAVKPLK